MRNVHDRFSISVPAALSERMKAHVSALTPRCSISAWLCSLAEAELAAHGAQPEPVSSKEQEIQAVAEAAARLAVASYMENNPGRGPGPVPSTATGKGATGATLPRRRGGVVLPGSPPSRKAALPSGKAV